MKDNSYYDIVPKSVHSIHQIKSPNHCVLIKNHKKNKSEMTCVHLFTGAEHTISIMAGTIGFLGLTVLSVSSTKAIMTYYERLRLK